MKATLWSVITILVGVMHASASAMADVVVIGNRGNDSALNQEQVVKLFTGKARFFPNGRPAKPVDQGEGASARAEFLDKVLHKSEGAMKSYWSEIVFTGNGVPPDVVSDDGAVKKFVSGNPAAIGYIDSKAVDDSVKVLFKAN